MKTIDYTKFGPEAPTPAGPVDRRWWLSNKDELADNLTGIMSFLKEHQAGREMQCNDSVRMYSNINLMNTMGLTRSRMSSVRNRTGERINYNVVQSGIDTVVSKICKMKPKPFFLTQGGSFSNQRKAKRLNKFVEGIFYENKAYELGREILRDGCVVGDGIVHVYSEHDRVKFERVISTELLCDEMEGFYGNPRQLHRVKNIDRLVLKDLFPSKAKKIMECNNAIPDGVSGYDNVADMVTLRESWHLPSGPDAKDGMHVISIENAVLNDDLSWDKPYFPFARFTWNKRLYGFWGQGAAEQIQSIQLEIAKLMWVIQRSMHLMGSFKIWVKTGSKIPKPHLNNDIGAIINGEEPPQYLVPPPIQGEFFNRLDWLKQAAYEQLGVSQMSAASIKAPGITSGEAIRTLSDVESERFMSVGQKYEELYLDLADLAIKTAKDIYEKNGHYEVKVPGQKFIDSIDWKDIDLEEEEYTMKCFPVSGLKGTPAENLQTIQEYMQAGLLSPRTGRKLLDFPDLQQVENLADAEEEYMTKILDKMVDIDPDSDDFATAYTAPEGGFDDLSLAHEMVLQYYAQGKAGGLDERNLNLLRQFKSQVEQQLGVFNQQEAPPQLGAPQAAPAQPPVSNLLANVPGIAA